MTQSQAYDGIKHMVPCLARARREYLRDKGVWASISDTFADPPDCNAYLIAAADAQGTDAVYEILDRVEE